MMPRVVAAEALDGLTEQDPSAIRSRRDLRRVHRVMGTRTIVAGAIRSVFTGHLRTAPLQVLELGAGDGTLMLAVARALAGEWRDVRLTLLDRQDLVTPATLSAYADLGWSARACVADALTWAEATAADGIAMPPAHGRWDLVIANLFLHHFEGAPLAVLLKGIADRTDRFIACEPRRSELARVGSHLIGLTGAGPVTREDAVLSVHAGFRGTEIGDAWAAVGNSWKTSERVAGLFSHCFIAQRVSPSNGVAP